MIKNAIIWLTGMSGSGKSTLAYILKENIESNGRSVSIIDGDFIRDGDDVRLGFGLDDVRTNNIRISNLCNEHRTKFDLVIVPVISPYEEVRQEVRTILEPNFHLVYLKVDIASLKDRDTKGLYAASDRGDIKDLIGYSDINPYDEPSNPELIVSTVDNMPLEKSLSLILDYTNKEIFNKKNRV